MPLNLPERPRRLRAHAAHRGLARETLLAPGDFIYPMFVTEGSGAPEPIATLPGQFRWPIPRLVERCAENLALGIGTVNLFGHSARKDAAGSAAADPEGLVPRAIRELKSALPALCVQSDIALDPYTTHGHDGLVIGGEVANDETIAALVEMALVHARAGVDWIAPSDMMDGRVGALRHALDAAGFSQVAILAYSAKYASSFYGPFRGALDSAPRSGDKKSYQMDPANAREALREVLLDVREGADAVMVKPASHYLDVLWRVREATHLPVAAYQVSGEYAMIHAAAERGWIDLRACMTESLTCIKRAGADMILTYFAPDMARVLRGDIPS